LLDHVFGGGAATSSAYTAPATLYVAVYTASPSDSGGGTELTIGTAGYARVAVTNNVANWANASGATATKVNANIITFPQATADWGTIVAFAVMDASTAGNFLWWGAVNALNTPPGKVIK